MSDVRISTIPQGPYHTEGTITIVGDDGAVIETTHDAWLCRCGGSATKPFCDGTHSTIGGFAPADAARDALTECGEHVGTAAGLAS